METLQSCTEPSIYVQMFYIVPRTVAVQRIRPKIAFNFSRNIALQWHFVSLSKIFASETDVIWKEDFSELQS